MATLTKYTKSLSGDFSSGFNQDKFVKEIHASSIDIALDRVDVSGDNVDIWFKDVLNSGNQTTLDSVVSAHDGIPEIKASTVKIQEETTKTGGRYKCDGFEISAAASEITSKTITFPIPISILSASWTSRTENDGDIVDALIGKDTDIGTITSAVAVNDIILDVSQGVIDNIRIGYYVNIDTESLGRVIAIDKTNLKITMDKVATITHNSGASVLMTIKMLINVVLTDGQTMSIGESSIGGSYIPANMDFKVMYDNKTASAKKFRFNVEYLY